MCLLVCASTLAYTCFLLCMALCLRGDGEIRTHDPLLARQVLSQLSYTPDICHKVADHTVDDRYASTKAKRRRHRRSWVPYDLIARPSA